MLYGTNRKAREQRQTASKVAGEKSVQQLFFAPDKAWLEMNRPVLLITPNIGSVPDSADANR
jgi:hypothetical protein